MPLLPACPGLSHRLLRSTPAPELALARLLKPSRCCSRLGFLTTAVSPGMIGVKQSEKYFYHFLRIKIKIFIVKNSLITACRELVSFRDLLTVFIFSYNR